MRHAVMLPLLILLFLTAAPSAADTPASHNQAGNISVQLAEFENDQGTVKLCLCRSENEYTGDTAVHAVRRGRVSPGETVMVISVGGCSAAAIQVCKAYGAKVISVVRSSEKQERALRLGADAALDSRRTAIPAAVRDLTDGLGVHCVIDGVGDADNMKTGIESL